MICFGLKERKYGMEKIKDKYVLSFYESLFYLIYLKI
jgi:hypothetical protein